MDVFDGPRILTKSTDTYKVFLDETIPHTKGYFILAPSGTGKTYYTSRQIEMHWIDGDALWNAAGAHPQVQWWTMGLEMILEVDARSDVITQEAKRLGLWIMGASNNWLTPDAVVLPPLETNIEYIKRREVENYDGGLTSSQIDQLKSHRQHIQEMALAKGIPVFESIDAATAHIHTVYTNNPQ